MMPISCASSASTLPSALATFATRATKRPRSLFLSDSFETEKFLNAA
jgi:hypothetical protein